MLNFENICRTCSLQGELQPLFVGDLPNPAEMLTEIDIKVTKGDKYPQNICKNCLITLKSAYIFKNQCRNVYNKFEHYLSLNSETIVDCKGEMLNAVFIKEENQSDYETDQKIFEFDSEPTSEPENKTNYQRHLNKHEQLKILPICGDQFTNKSLLEQHSRKKLNKISYKHCEKRKHKVEHADDELDISNETIEKTFSTEKISQKIKKKLCDYCGLEYRNVSDLNAHIRTHTGEKPFACIECDKSFRCKRFLLHHQRINHSSDKPYKCDFCGKCFAYTKWLKNHLKIHTNDKPYTCDICNQKFRQRHHLTRHRFVHTGEKPFSCNICNKQFTQNSNLRTHMRTHTGEKPYLCSICGKGFHDSSSKKNHQKKHTLFEENQNVSPVSNTKK